MALTFKVAALLEVIDGVVTAQDEAETTYVADCAAARKAYQQQWEDDNTTRVRELRNYLSECLRNGKPPLTAEARAIVGPDNHTRYDSGISFFTPGGDAGVKRNDPGYYHMDELDGLAALLRAHVGETVTAHQLKELGTHPRDLEKLFRTAATAGAAVSK